MLSSETKLIKKSKAIHDWLGLECKLGQSSETKLIKRPNKGDEFENLIPIEKNLENPYGLYRIENTNRISSLGTLETFWEISNTHSRSTKQNNGNYLGFQPIPFK